MPGMTGDELARQLRQSDRGLKVLYLTGYSDRLFKEKTGLWVDEAFLEKPFTSKGLREALSLLVFGRLAHSEPDTAGEPSRLPRSLQSLTSNPQPPASASPSVHLEVRVFLQRRDRHEGATVPERESVLGAAVAALAPARRE